MNTSKHPFSNNEKINLHNFPLQTMIFTIQMRLNCKMQWHTIDDDEANCILRAERWVGGDPAVHTVGVMDL